VKLLLDTCAFLWIAADAPELSAIARDLFANRSNDVFLSAVSAWEIAVKHTLGRLPLPARPVNFVVEQRRKHLIEPLPLEEEAALHLLNLPPLHRDPFDRMLVCQAIAHGLAILTPDERIRQYPVRTAW
jgi:PIN domain nuclease of toxin-antitoxin system